jgi:formylglycine-generating enzyme required for sulfatase activity
MAQNDQDTRTDLPKGTLLLDRYQIAARLGRRGGYGITYEAQDTRLDRRVAIKELYPYQMPAVRVGPAIAPEATAVAKFDEQKSKFLIEGQRLAGIEHENIVRVYDAVEANNTVYLIMQFLEGVTLHEHVKSPLPWAEAVALLEQIAPALTELHSQNPPLIHQDVKPENIMRLHQNGKLVLIDFGGVREIAAVDKSMSHFGTLGFAAPEQFTRNHPRGTFTDVYGLTATLDWLITCGEDIRYIPNIPTWLLEALDKGMVAAGSERIQTVTLLLERLKFNKQNDKKQSVTLLAKPLLIPSTFPLLEQYLSEMCNIPACSFEMGSFQMGSTMYSHEHPIHRVTLSEFFIGRTSVTVGMWQEYCYAIKMVMPQLPSFHIWKDGWASVLNHPIVNVSWEDCVVYSRWASTVSGKLLVLPSEAQWECAARGGKGGWRYPWKGNFERDLCWCSNKSEGDAGGTASVLRNNNIFVNGYGLIDISGNVWEWCRDCYTEDWYKQWGAIERDPENKGYGASRVLRGCSWYSFDPDTFRCACRNAHNSSKSSTLIGFRLSIQEGY